MADTVPSGLVVVPVLEQAMQAAFRGRRAFQGSRAVRTAYDMPGPVKGGATVRIPYFSVLGEAEDLAETDSATPEALTQSYEDATVSHFAKAIEVLWWAQLQGRQTGDVYGEGGRQLAEIIMRRAERKLIAQAVGSNSMSKTATGSSTSMTYDDLVDTIALFGDREDKVALWVFHPVMKASLRKLKDSYGHPLFVEPVEGKLPMLMGAPVVVSEMAPITFTITNDDGGSTGPATITHTGQFASPSAALSGTANKPSLKIKISTAGSRGTAQFQWSMDGGVTYSAAALTAATVALAGTDIVLAFATGTYVLNDTYTGVNSYHSIACEEGSLALWWNGMPRLRSLPDVLKDADILAAHAYAAAYAYKRLPESTRPGIARLIAKS